MHARHMLAAAWAAAAYASPAPAPTPAAIETSVAWPRVSSVSFLPTSVGVSLASPASSTTSFNTDAWVTVNKKGVLSTVTPFVSLASNGPTLVDAYPQRPKPTETGYKPAMAKNKNGKGSFPICRNLDGPYAPFCEPAHNASLIAGKTYYVTWDTAFFPSPLTTTTNVIVKGSTYNATTGEEMHEVFASDTLPGNKSYYAWKVDKKMLKGAFKDGANISISMSYLSYPIAMHPNATLGYGNGTYGNGTYGNGTFANGTYANGTYANATLLALALGNTNTTLDLGSALNGTLYGAFNGTWGNGTFANGTYPNGTAVSRRLHGPIVRVAKKQPYRQEHAKMPTGAALYLGIPLVLMFIGIMVTGTYLMARHHGRITVHGSVMGRERLGRFSGLGTKASAARKRGYPVVYPSQDKEVILLKDRKKKYSATRAKNARSGEHGAEQSRSLLTGFDRDDDRDDRDDRDDDDWRFDTEDAQLVADKHSTRHRRARSTAHDDV